MNMRNVIALAEKQPCRAYDNSATHPEAYLTLRSTEHLIFSLLKVTILVDDYLTLATIKLSHGNVIAFNIMMGSSMSFRRYF